MTYLSSGARIVVALLAASWLPSAWAAGIHLQNQGDGISAVDDRGRTLWRRRIDLLQPIQIDKTADGRFRINGDLVLDARGRIVTDAAGDGKAPVAASASYVWQTPVPTYDTYSGSNTAVVFDQNGNAWTVVDDAVAGKARVMKYVATKGIWKEVKKLPQIFADGRLDVDPLGNVTIVVLSASEADGYQLHAVRYEADGGWSGDTVIYAIPYAPQAMVNYDVVGDKSGNAVVAAGEIFVGGISVVYSSATRSWQPAQPLQLPAHYAGTMVNAIALSRSPNAKRIAVAYVGFTEDPAEAEPVRGIYSNTFDISTLSFGPSEVLPRSKDLLRDGNIGSDNYEDRVSMVIDNDGAESIVWYSNPNIKSLKLLGTYASRRTNGAWANPVKLDPALYNFGQVTASIAVSADGRVGACVTGATGQAHADTEFVVFKFIPGVGWSKDVVDRWTGTLETRSRIAWFGSGQAVGAYLVADSSLGYQALSSSVFDGSAWGSRFPIPPDQLTTFDQSIATSPKTKMPLLLFNPTGDSDTGDGDITTKVYATFLEGAS